MDEEVVGDDKNGKDQNVGAVEDIQQPKAEGDNQAKNDEQEKDEAKPSDEVAKPEEEK